MITFSEKFTLIFFLVGNGILIAAGMGMIGQGIYRQVSGLHSIADEFDNSQADGTSNIITGCIDIAIGACGIVGALLKRRVLLIINSAMLACLVIWNLCLMVAFGVYGAEAQKTITKNLKISITTQFGNNSNSRDFTNSIEQYHKSAGCCGWNGIEGENLYIKSPWYNQINTNASGKRRTLPDSCCAKAGPECNTAENVKVARTSGFVYEFDCMERIVGRLKFYMWSSIVYLMLMTLVQMLVLAFSGLIYIQGIKGQ